MLNEAWELGPTTQRRRGAHNAIAVMGCDVSVYSDRESGTLEGEERFCCCEATFAHIIFGLFFYLPSLKHSLDKDLCYARDHINALSLSLVALCGLVSGRMVVVTMCVQMLLSYL